MPAKKKTTKKKRAKRASKAAPAVPATEPAPPEFDPTRPPGFDPAIYMRDPVSGAIVLRGSAPAPLAPLTQEMVDKHQVTGEIDGHGNQGAPVDPPTDPSAVRRKVKLDRVADTAAGTLTMTDCISGEAFTFVLSALPMEVKVNSALYGIVRKIDNSKDPLESARQIMAGVWPGRVVKKGSAVKPKRYAMPVEALARVSGKTPEEAKAMWDTLDEEQRKQLKKDHRILSAIDAIRVERSGEKQAESSVLDTMLPGPTAVPAAVAVLPGSAPPALPNTQMAGATPAPSPITGMTGTAPAVSMQPAVPPQPAEQVYYDAAGNPIPPPAPGTDLSTPVMAPPWMTPTT